MLFLLCEPECSVRNGFSSVPLAFGVSRGGSLYLPVQLVRAPLVFVTHFHAGVLLSKSDSKTPC